MVQYHVTLAGQGYMLDLDGYRRRLATQFAPKRSSGARGLGDFLVEDGLRISDWSGGEGYAQLDPAHPERYRAGSGLDAYSERGALSLGPELTSAFNLGAAGEWTCAAVFDGNLYIGVSNGDVIKWTGSSASVPMSLSPRVARSMAVFANELYVGNGTDGVVGELTTGGVWTASKFTVGSCSGIHAMATFYRQTAQYLYVGAKGTGPNGIASAYYYDGSALSAKQYDFEETSVDAMFVLGNRLYWLVNTSNSRRCGIYSVDDSGSGGVYRHHEVLHGNTLVSAAVVDDAAYLGSGTDGQVYRWDGSSLELKKQLATAQNGYATPMRGLVNWQGALWAPYLISVGSLGLLRYDPRLDAWSRPSTGLTGDEPMVGVSFLGALYLGTKRGSSPTHVYRTTGKYQASGTTDTGLFDAGLPHVDKVLRTVTILHSALASGQSIQVQYQLEGTGSWTTLGTSSTLGATSATFSFPGIVTCKQVAFRVNLAGSAGASSSPVLYDLLLRYRVSPTPKREWELPILLEGTADLPLVTLDHAPEPLTGVQLSAALWAAKAQSGTLSFTDINGLSYSVWFEDLREEIAELSQRRGYQLRGIARLVEA
ncbi:MAG: hypothetical protein IT201_14620 [Thermoleophilia bacterium]|nr:hypothetical protein [Thermoleophilia bacterium]